MLTDAKPKLSKADSKFLKRNDQRGGRQLENGFSLSGGERDHLFLSQSGEQFYDIGAIAGLADPADGRALAILDLDHDGWRDFVVANANAPSLRIYRNQVAQRGQGGAKGGMIALRFVGGNTAAAPGKLSNRDGYGSRVSVTLADMTLTREHTAGEGYAAQNSSTMIVGIGKNATVVVSVRFPNGTSHQLADVRAGQLLTVYEAPQMSPSGKPFVVSDYVRASPYARADGPEPKPTLQRLANFAPEPAGKQRPKLVMYTTTATWCGACKRELPQLERLAKRFSREQLAMRGLPIDLENDDKAKLEAYLAEYKPSYTLLLDRTEKQVTEIQALLLERLAIEGLPATVITNADAEVLATMFGVPSASDINRLLDGR